MSHIRTFRNLLLGLVLVSGAALAPLGAATTAPAASDLILALQASDGSPESLARIAQLAMSQNPSITAEQVELLASSGMVAPNHLELVAAIVAIQGDASLDAVSKGFRIAEVTTQAQAKALGVDLAPAVLAGHALPSDALLALAQSANVALSEDEIAEARALDTLPAPQAAALARLVDAFTAMDAAATGAIAENPDAPAWGETLGARLALLDASKAFRALPMEDMGEPRTASAFQLYNIDLTGADSFYATNYAFSLDVGGDDMYRNNGGGNWAGDCGLPTTASAFIDLAGDDTYAPAYDHHPDPAINWWWADSCGKVGGAKNGVGFLLDVGGSNQFGGGQSDGVNGGASGAASLGSLYSLASAGDRFSAGGYGTNGGAYQGGVGLLVSTGTGSTYMDGGWQGSNGGAANGGLGMMIDLGQGSSYWAGGEGTNGGAYGAGSVGFAYGAGYWSGQWNGVNGGGAQGGAGTLVSPSGSSFTAGCNGTNGGADGLGSTGALYAQGGWDYQACDYGTNGGGANGGHGTLVDTLGFATFRGGSYGSNGGAHGIGSSGFLYTMGGSFTAGSHGTNGGGDTNAVGTLLTLGGSIYSASSYGTNGGAHQGGLGALIDAGLTGASYTAGRYGTNGGADASGIGLLVDAAGNDRYTANGFGANGAGDVQGHGTLIDLAGNDAYTCSAYSCNGQATSIGSTGFLLDVQGNDTYNGTPNQTQPFTGSGLAGNQIDVSPI